MAHETDRVDTILSEWRREHPSIDPSAMGIIGRVHRLATRLDAELGANFARFDLTSGEFDVLAALRRAGAPFARGASELADHTMITVGGLTKRVDRLERRRLVERSVDIADARARTIALTPAGVALVDEVFRAHVETEDRLVASLGADGEKFAEMMKDWLRALGER